MRPRGKTIVIIASSLFVLILVSSALLYSPKIPGGRQYNLPGKIFNLFAYVYYFTKAQWLTRMGEMRPARRALVLAAWHRPAMIGQLTLVDPGDYFALGQRYASLGLGDEAGYFFRTAYSGSSGDKSRALEIVSYLAILGDWPSVRSLSENILDNFPESAEANYWLGRSLVETGHLTEALPFLDQAYDLNASETDAVYQKGRAYERSGEKDKALVQYAKAAESSPGHRDTWQALHRIYSLNQDNSRLERTVEMLKQLSPPVIEDFSVENMFLLLGHSFNQENVSTGDTITIELYLQGWRFQPITIQPEVVFIDLLGMEARRVLEEVTLRNQGVVGRESRQCKVPEYLAPGPIKVLLSFRDPETTLQLGLNNYAENDITLSRLDLKPRWLPSMTGENLVKRHFGENAYPVRKSAFLTKGSSLGLPLKVEGKVAALGLVSGVFSFLRNRIHLFQGQEIGSILVETQSGERVGLPIRLGEHTADIFWDRPAPISPRHRKVNIFSSAEAEWHESHPAAHQYFAIYEFPAPISLQSVKIECSGPGLTLQVIDLILVPDDI